jgi:hypothetical protein
MNSTAAQFVAAVTIGLVALTCAVGSIVLLIVGKPVDAAVTGLGGTALGYLAGLVSPNPLQRVQIDQPASKPVPTTDAAPPRKR